MIPRHLTPRLVTALGDSPIVYLQGARQTGKSTLVQALAKSEKLTSYVTLDTAAVLGAVENDPEGFVRGLEGRTVIDEVQRVPRLALALKTAIDKDRRPGRFLLTGSASVMSLPQLSESLAGRMELHTLWPLSQGEITGRRETFIDRAFAASMPLAESKALPEAELVRRIIVGGYPEAMVRKKEDRRRAWFDSYVTAILQRDVRELANIDKLADVPRILTLLASRVGELLNFADLSRTLSIPQTTIKRYMALLEATFLVRLLPAWFSNIGKRLAKSPKLLLVDTGLLTHLLDVNARRLRANRTLLGHIVENFVAMELIKQLGWAKKQCKLFHFRTESGQEVDLVLENSAGRLVGIEVKAAATVSNRDFRGLEALRDIAGSRFTRGIVLYTGDLIVPFSADLRAVPISQLWG